MLNIGYLTSDTTASGDEMFTPFYAVTPLVKYQNLVGIKPFGAHLTRNGAHT